MRTISALLLLIAALPGQEATQNPDSRQRQNRMDARIQAAKERAAKEGKDWAKEIGGKEGMSAEELEHLAKLQIEAEEQKNGVRGAGAFCRFVASAKPAKLMPGQSGTMRVTALLSGQAVLQAPAGMEILSGTRQGLVSFGAPTFQPAENAKLAPAYLGHPVYDNYLVFDLPVTMAPDAEVGKKQPIQLDLRFEIFDGTTAQSIGRFIDRAATEIEVGSVPDPAVKGGASAPAERVDAPAAAKATSRENAPVAAPPSERVIKGSTPTPVAEEVARTAPPPTLPEPDRSLDSSESVPVLPLAIGGGMLLLLVVLLVSRKR